jgi:hypothetical protein
LCYHSSRRRLVSIVRRASSVLDPPHKLNIQQQLVDISCLKPYENILFPPTYIFCRNVSASFYEHLRHNTLISSHPGGASRSAPRSPLAFPNSLAFRQPAQRILTLLHPTYQGIFLYCAIGYLFIFTKSRAYCPHGPHHIASFSLLVRGQSILAMTLAALTRAQD